MILISQESGGKEIASGRDGMGEGGGEGEGMVRAGFDPETGRRRGKGK